MESKQLLKKPHNLIIYWVVNKHLYQRVYERVDVKALACKDRPKL